jgi:hypothetical protein
MLMCTPHRWVRPKRLQPPGFIRPCQPVLSAKVPYGDGWIHELKHDGFRIVALKDGGEVRPWSRNGRNWSADLLAITAAVRALPVTRIVLDGEAVAHFPCAARPRGLRESVPVRLRPLAGRRRRPSRAYSRRAPGLAPGASEAHRRRDHLQRAHGGCGRRGDVPSRLRPGTRRHRVETGDQPLQVRPVRGVGQGEEPGL